MRRLATHLGLIAFLAALASTALAQEKGIAAKYPNDRGIIKNKYVVFCDNFERKDFARWDENQHAATTRLTRSKKNVHAGRQSVEMTSIIPGSTGGGLIKWFLPGFDRMYARFYVKFAKDHSYVHHFVHIVAGRDRWSGFGKAGLRPNGRDFFTTGIEPDGKWGRVKPPGVWHFYTYWPDMRGSRGRYWGNDFSPSRPVTIPRGKWICVELMVKANSTPTKRDGEQAFWINGKKAGHFKGIRWRHTNALKINAFWLLYYVTPEALRRHRIPSGGRYRVWFDDVVVARRYVGPMKTKGSSGPKSDIDTRQFILPPGFKP